MSFIIENSILSQEIQNNNQNTDFGSLFLNILVDLIHIQDGQKQINNKTIHLKYYKFATKFFEEMVIINFDSTTRLLEIKMNLFTNFLSKLVNSHQLAIELVKTFEEFETKRQVLAINIENREITARCIQTILETSVRQNVSKEKTFRQYVSQIIKEKIKFCRMMLLRIQNSFKSKKSIQNQRQNFELQKLVNISTIKANFQLDIKRTNISTLQSQHTLQQQQLLNIQKNLILLDENNQTLSLYVEENLRDYSNFKKQRLPEESRTILEDSKEFNKIQGKKEVKIGDYTYNTARIRASEEICFNSGGVCNIFYSMAQMSWIYSEDYQEYQENGKPQRNTIAIKRIKDQMKRYQFKINHEHRIVKYLKWESSVYLPKYYGVKNGQRFSDSILMERIYGCDLNDYFLLSSRTISLKTKLLIFFNILAGIRVLSDARITHLDLKPWNIMVTNDLITKIIDFGQSHHPELCNQDFSHGYTFPYAAPQVIKRIFTQQQNQLQFSQKQDIFALGNLMNEYILKQKFLKFPFKNHTKHYINDSYGQMMMIAPQKYETMGKTQNLNYLLNVGLKSIDPQIEKRPRADLLGIIIKVLIKN